MLLNNSSNSLLYIIEFENGISLNHGKCISTTLIIFQINEISLNTGYLIED